MPENGILNINGDRFEVVFRTPPPPRPRRSKRGAKYTPGDHVLFDQPQPGWAPPLIGEFNGECLRCTMASLAGIHPRDIKPIIPGVPGQTGTNFWSEYHREMARHGFRIVYADGRPHIERFEKWKLADLPAHYSTPGHLWGAVVPVPRRAHKSHALVMEGGRVHYDTSPGLRPSGQRPRKFYSAFTLEPLH